MIVRLTGRSRPATQPDRRRPSELAAVLDRFSQLRVLVIGEAMLDSYCFGTSTRLCQEAPVPVVAVRERRDQAGGAANTAVNLAALGCQVTLLSVVGADAEGDRLRALLRDHDVSTALVARAPGRGTLAKQRVVNDRQLMVRVDQGDTGPIDRSVEWWLRARLDAAFIRADAVVISDYGYGVVTAGLVSRLRTLQDRYRQLVTVDSRDLGRYRALEVTAVKPNFQEAVRLCGVGAEELAGPRAAVAAAIGDRVLERTGARIAAITLDVDGAVVVERGRPPYRTGAEPADQARAAGAGDTFVAALTLALAAGASTPQAAEIAAGAAGVVVGADGTTVCSSEALRQVLHARGRAPSGAGTAGRPQVAADDPAGGATPRSGSPSADHRSAPAATSPDAPPPAAARPAEPPPPDPHGDPHARTADRPDLGDRRTPALHQA